jgi:hypothetical protein
MTHLPSAQAAVAVLVPAEVSPRALSIANFCQSGTSEINSKL